MLNSEILLRIYTHCDLEKCVTLSQVCKDTNTLFDSLDTTLVRDKVLERVPWFDIRDSNASKWTDCARLVVARTAKAMDTKKDHLYLLKDLMVAANRGANKIVKMDKYPNLHPSVKAGFDDLRAKAQKTASTAQKPSTGEDKGSGEAIKTSTDDPDTTEDSLEPSADETSDSELPEEGVCTAPSGTTVTNMDGPVRIIAENDKLIQVRYSPYLGEGEGDTLIVKEAADEDEQLNKSFFLDGFERPMFPGPGVHKENEPNVAAVQLLPGNGGAFVITSKIPDKPHKQMLFYVQPDKELTHVLICSLPPSMTYKAGYSDSENKFILTHNGYLYVYLAGRLIRLWVDLGYRSELNDSLDSDSNLEDVQNYCLALWDDRFPLIGSFGDEVKEDPRGFQLERSTVKSRYFTVGGNTQIFGDLVTGKTMMYGDVEGAQDKIRKRDLRLYDYEYVYRPTEEEEEETAFKNKLEEERKNYAKQLAKAEKERLREEKKEQKRLRKEERAKKREKTLTERLRREEEREREAFKEMEDRAHGNGDVEVLAVVNKEVIDISSASDLESDSESEPESEVATEVTDEDEEYDSVAEFCKEEFGMVDADDHWERVYQDREYERQRYMSEGSYPSEEDIDSDYEYYDTDVFEKHVIYANLYRDVTKFNLDPSNMLAPRAFVPVYHPRNGKRATLKFRKRKHDYWRR